MRSILALVGPTGVGKSKVALEVAKATGGQIISCDSRAVYRYMDIGTAKPTPEERDLVPHHLIDEEDPSFLFTAAHYVRRAREQISNLRKRGIPIVICGGTGWYLKALIHGLDPFPASDPAVRGRLMEELLKMGCSALHRRLTEIDPIQAVRIHPNDKYRVLRALEIYEIAQKPPSLLAKEGKEESLTLPVLTVVLHCEREELVRRIERRTRAMIETGLVAEVENLRAKGFDDRFSSLRSVGYAQVFQMLRGELAGGGLESKIAEHTKLLAKRQLTWWRSVADAKWVEWKQSEILPSSLIGKWEVFEREEEG